MRRTWYAAMTWVLGLGMGLVGGHAHQSPSAAPLSVPTTSVVVVPADTSYEPPAAPEAPPVEAPPEPEPEPQPQASRGGVEAPQGPTFTTPSLGEARVGLEPCGGDLPPCWVKARESGGNYGAVNWGGCGGANCYGAWQFGGFWAGKLGLPEDIINATPEQQDEAARILWAGGAGCGNWAAC